MFFLRKGNYSRKSMEAMSRREKILKWMLLALLSAATLPMQGQKQGSDYVLHIRHLDADAPVEYTYDAKGRMTSDKNSGITGITYTLEGYPLVISYGNGNSTEYVYTADGRKLRATYRTAAENVSEPLSSVSQSTAKALVETVRDYAGDAVYENGELVRVLTPEGYVEKSGSGYAHYYYIRDYQGNVRVVADATGAVKEENGYYPFGMLHGGDGGIQPYKYNGKELDRMHGLEWYDYGARMYNGYRFTTPDPLSERYYSTSPYAYCLNNPIKYIDPDGRSINPIYSQEGELLGTDDRGLQGDAIIMDSKFFQQGMKHEDAIMFDLGISILDENTRKKVEANVQNLENRPDYDGILTWSEANDWYRDGLGLPLFVDVSKINLSPVTIKNLSLNKTIYYNYFSADHFNLETGLVYGTLAITLLDEEGKVRVGSINNLVDVYDFDYQKGRFLRNFATKIGKTFAGKGEKYKIFGYGYGTVK